LPGVCNSASKWRTFPVALPSDGCSVPFNCFLLRHYRYKEHIRLSVSQELFVLHIHWDNPYSMVLRVLEQCHSVTYS
jgi:hypothetical protein